MTVQEHEDAAARVDTRGHQWTVVPHRSDGRSAGCHEALTDRAAQNIYNANGDFTLAIRAAKTPNDLHTLHRMLTELIQALSATCDSAMTKADAIVRGM